MLEENDELHLVFSPLLIVLNANAVCQAITPSLNIIEIDIVCEVRSNVVFSSAHCS